MAIGFEKDCLHTMDLLHECIWNPYRSCMRFMSEFKDTMQVIHAYLANNIHKQRILHIIFNTKRMCRHKRRLNIIKHELGHAGHPCFVYPNINNNEPSHLSLKYIGSFIINQRLSDKSEKIREIIDKYKKRSSEKKSLYIQNKDKLNITKYA
eukprot:594043_1